jgi:hypothetical protein
MPDCPGIAEQLDSSAFIRKGGKCGTAEFENDWLCRRLSD